MNGTTTTETAPATFNIGDIVHITAKAPKRGKRLPKRFIVVDDRGGCFGKYEMQAVGGAYKGSSTSADGAALTLDPNQDPTVSDKLDRYASGTLRYRCDDLGIECDWGWSAADMVHAIRAARAVKGETTPANTVDADIAAA